MLGLLAILSRRRPRGRALLAVLGIALGVALAYGVFLVNRAAVEDLAASVRALAGEADLQVRGGRSGFDEALHPALTRLEGVAWVNPVLELEAGIAGTERTLRVVGADTLRLGHPQLLAPDKVLLSPLAAAFVGDGPLELAVAGARVRLEVEGVSTELKGFSALADIATAQWRFARLGELNRLDLYLEPGADRAAVAANVAALLPPGVHVESVEALERASGYPTRAYRVNLNVLAMVALFTGGFLVFSAQALELARRRAEHALLRVLGLTAGGLARLLLLEAAALGALGGVLGVALGYGVAAAALRFAGADLGTGMFRALAPQLSFAMLPALLYLLSGVLVAIAGALLPALDASRAPAAQALKAGDEQRLLAGVARPWAGLALLLAGVVLSFLGPVRGLPLFGYAAIACLLVGAIALMPAVSRMAFHALPLTRSPVLSLAIAQLRGAAAQAAVSLAAIVASFSLIAAMAIMVNSFRASVADWLEAVLPADLYFRTTHAGDTGYLEADFEARVRALPQVERVEFLRSGRVLLDVTRPPLSLIARDRAPASFPLVGERSARRAGDPPLIWVSEAVADVYGMRPGMQVTLPVQGRALPFKVGGVFRDYARQHGAILMERGDYVRLTGDTRVNDAALWVRPGAKTEAVAAALRALPGGAQLEIAAPPEIREASLQMFDRSFAVTYALEAVAVLVGMFGLSSSLGAIVLARRREFGMLRHLGVTRGQIRAMLATEGALLALLGAIAGLACGAAISIVLVHVVNRQSFSWSMQMHWPWGLLAGLAALLVALAVLTALLSGREAMGMGPVRAVREDW